MTEKEFWSNCTPIPYVGCWIWDGSIKGVGYGQTELFEGKRRYAHRLAYALTTGEIPAGYHICHTCDEPGCINPEHLFAGTCADNHADMVRKGRSTRGERDGMAVLTSSDVVEIRGLLQRGKLSHGEIGKMFGVTSSNIWCIQNGISWKWLKEEESIQA